MMYLRCCLYNLSIQKFFYKERNYIGYFKCKIKGISIVRLQRDKGVIRGRKYYLWR